MKNADQPIPFPVTEELPSVVDATDTEERYWDPDEIQEVIREAYARGVDPSTLFRDDQPRAEELRPAA